MSKILQEICDKFLLIDILDKALIVARMLKHNEEMRYKQLQKIESVYALLNEIKSSLDLQWLKEGPCYAHFKKGESNEGLLLKSSEL